MVAEHDSNFFQASNRVVQHSDVFRIQKSCMKFATFATLLYGAAADDPV
jgi:hypothetical protein